MAVLQISKIQIRRGTAGGGTGIPQLASGELAWALDTQELWIGNGSVAEGAPAVGNTKIITSNDFTTGGNVLNLISHIYRATDNSMQTGPNSNSPISRLLQDRLDDRVTVFDFGAIGDGVIDDTAAIQRAINQIFLNPTTKASADTSAGVSARKILEFPAGIYKITSTIFVPSYANLIGAGNEKTILRLDGASGPLMQFVNDTSTIGNPATLESTTYNNQPKFIRLESLSLFVNSSTETALRMNAARNCDIFNVTFRGKWNNNYDSNCIGIEMNAFTSLVTCEKNHFSHVDISEYSHAIVALGDINSNEFNDMHVENLFRGFALGYNIISNEFADGITIGQKNGPRNNSFNNIDFSNVKKQAILLGLGDGNLFANIILNNIGNDGYGNVSPLFPQVYIGSPRNNTQDIKSDRIDELSLSYTPLILATISATSAVSNLVTVSTNTGFYFNLPIRITGATLGNLTLNTTYFVRTILSTSNISIESYSRNASDIVTINTSSLHGLVNNQTVSISGGTIVDQNNVLVTVVDANTFTFLSSSSGVLPLTTSTTGIVTPATQITLSTTSLGPTMTQINSTGLAAASVNWNAVPFIPVVAGFTEVNSWGQYRVDINDFSNSFRPIMRLALNSNLLGISERSVHYNIEYLYTTNSNSFVRAGDITLTAEADTPYISMSDQYDFAGPLEDPEEVDVNPVALEFKAEIFDSNGALYVSSPQVPSSIVISYRNSFVDGLGNIAFSVNQLLR